MSTRVSISTDGTIEITPKYPSAALIFAHGLGGTAHGWVDTMAVLAKDLPHVKFVLPSAMKISVGASGRVLTRAWFDDEVLDTVDGKMASGIETSSKHLMRLINKQVKAGIATSRIVLGGFDQGGTISLYTGSQLTGTVLAGVLSLSGPLPVAFDIAPESVNTPVFIGHSEEDEALAFDLATKAMQTLVNQGFTDVECHGYLQMEKKLSPEVAIHVTKWLQRILAITNEWKA